MMTSIYKAGQAKLELEIYSIEGITTFLHWNFCFLEEEAHRNTNGEDIELTQNGVSDLGYVCELHMMIICNLKFQVAYSVSSQK